MVTNILILDDLTSVAELIKVRLGQEGNLNKILITHCTNEVEFRREIDTSDPNDTLLMVNAAYKSSSTSYRFKMNGITQIIKSGLRIAWFKRHPVVAYCTLPKEEVLGNYGGDIFLSSRSHIYFNLTKIRETNLKSLIKKASCIQNDSSLRSFIYDFCARELKEFIGYVMHNYIRTDRTYQLDDQQDRSDLSNYIEHLQKILPDGCIRESIINETLALLEGFRRSKRKIIEQNLELLENNLESVVKNLQGKILSQQREIDYESY